MATSKRTKTQVRRDRSALNKLKSTGLYTGKLDLRKRPTAYQRKLIQRYADVIGGKSTVVRPANPASYKGLFQVKGKAVIVPKRKGERVAVDKKTGEITSTRKTVGGRVVRSRVKLLKKEKPIERPATPKNVQYAIPFVRGDRVEWMRFPNYDLLKQFMEGYDYKNWQEYVIEERIGNDERLEAKLERKITKQRKSQLAKKKKARR